MDLNMPANKLFILIGLYFSTVGADNMAQWDVKEPLHQLVVISRHGSRTLLTKDHKTFEEGSDSPLTVRGMDQMFRAGKFVKNHYRKFNFLPSSYSQQDIYVRSSDYSRTLNSAQSFLLGLYQLRNQSLNVSYAGQVFYAPYNIQQVPIHTVAEKSDQLLRGWLSCPELIKRLTTFYESKEFKNKEAETASFRQMLESVLGIEKIELKDFYNVYDYIHLHRLYNHTVGLHITEEQWDKVVDLADWVESKKYSKEIIGDIGGGLLASEIAFNFQKVAQKQSKMKLLYYSAHYPTILSLFTSLGLNVTTIPYYASLVFIELRSAKNKYFVQLSFKNGLEAPLKSYSIPECEVPCPLARFLYLVTSVTVHDVTSWCHACSNNKLSQCQVSEEKPECPSVKKSKLSGTGGFFLGAFVTLLLVIFITASWHFCLKKRCLPRGDGRRTKFGLSDLENVPSSSVI